MPKFKIEVKTKAVQATQTSAAVPSKLKFSATVEADNAELAAQNSFFNQFRQNAKLEVSAPQPC